MFQYTRDYEEWWLEEYPDVRRGNVTSTATRSRQQQKNQGNNRLNQLTYSQSWIEQRGATRPQNETW